MKTIYDVTEADEQEMHLLVHDGHAYGYAPGGESYIACSLDAHERHYQPVYIMFEGATFWPYILYGSLICIKRPNVGDRIPLGVLSHQWMEAGLRAAVRRTARLSG